MRFSPDGRRLATGTRPINVWDLNDRAIEYSIGHDLVILEAFDLDWHSDSNQLAAGLYNNQIWIINVDAKKVDRFTSDSSAIQSIRWSPDGKKLVCATRGQAVCLYNSANLTKEASFLGHIGWVNSVDFHPSGNQLVSGGHDGQIKIWDVPKQPAPNVGSRIPIDLTSPDGKQRALSDGRLPINVYSKQSDKPQLLLQIGSDQTGQQVENVSWDPSGVIITTQVGGDGMTTWSTETGKQIGNRSYARGNAFDIAPNGRWVAYAAHPFLSPSVTPIRIWDAVEQELVGPVLYGHPNGVFGMSFSPDSKRLVSVGTGEIKIWDTVTGKILTSIIGHQSGKWLTKPAWSPDGNLVATGGWDQKVKLWDSTTGREQRSLEGHTKSIHSLAFSPDGSRLVTGAGNGIIKIWDVATGREVISIDDKVITNWGSKAITHIHWSDDGKQFAAQYDPNYQRVFDSSRGRQVAGTRRFFNSIERARKISAQQKALRAYHAKISRAVSTKLALEPDDPIFNPQQSLVVASSAAAVEPTADSLITKALAQIRNEQWIEATESLKNASALNPRTSSVIEVMNSIIFFKTDQLEKSIESYFKSIDDKDHSRRGSIEIRLRIEAEDLIKDQLWKHSQNKLKLHPNDLLWLKRSASLAIRLGKHDDAIRSLNAIIRQNPRDLSSIVQLASALSTRANDSRKSDAIRKRDSDDWKKAKSLFEQAVKLATEGKSSIQVVEVRRRLAEHLLGNAVTWRSYDDDSWVQAEAVLENRLEWKLTSNNAEPVSAVRLELEFDSAAFVLENAEFEAIKKSDGSRSLVEVKDVVAPFEFHSMIANYSLKPYPRYCVDDNPATHWTAHSPEARGRSRSQNQNWIVFEFEKPLELSEFDLIFTGSFHSQPPARHRFLYSSGPAVVKNETFLTMLNEHSINPDIRLASGYLMLDQPERAKQLLDSVILSKAPFSNADLLIMARIFADLNLPNESQRWLKRAVANLEPEPLGFVLQFLAGTYEKFIQAAPNFADADVLKSLAEIQAELGLKNSGIESYNRAIELEPANQELILGRAKLFLRTQRFKDAIGDFERLVELMPADFKAKLWLAVLLLKDNNTDGYTKLRQSTLSAADELTGSNTDMALMLMLRPIPANNQRLLQIAKSNTNSKSFIVAALANYRQSKFEESIRQCELFRAKNVRGNNPVIHSKYLFSYLIQSLAHSQLRQSASAQERKGHYENERTALQRAIRYTDYNIDSLGLCVAKVLEMEVPDNDSK